MYGIQHVCEPTHVHGHTLDVVIARDTSSILSDVEVTDPGLCDHLGKMSRDHFAENSTTNIIRSAPIYKIVSFGKLRCIDVETFKRDITYSTILQPFNGSVDELANYYNNGLHSRIDKHAPLCTKRIVLMPS